MEKNLLGKIALVTGGSKGIGKIIAETLAHAGASIVIVARSQNEIEKTVLEIKKTNADAWGVVCDVTKPEQVKKIFDENISKFGHLDILINNVGGIDTFGGFLELQNEDWKKCYDLNFMSHVFFIRESYQFLKKSNSPRIINISTLAAKQPGFYNPHYSAAKAALLNLSKHLANVLAKDKILVNAICLSTVKTEIWKTSVENKMKQLNVSFEEAQNIYQHEEEEKNPLHQLGAPEDIAELVAFLASDKAKWITGSCFTVDGGTSRGLY